MRIISLCIVISIFAASCGHTLTREVGLMSSGDLEGKVVPQNKEGTFVKGQSCGMQSYLSDAFRDAIKGTSFDTILNATVKSETGFLVANNCLIISGQAYDSTTWGQDGGVQ